MVNVLDDKKKKLQELIKPVNDTQPVAGVNAPVPQRDIMAEIQKGISENQDVSNLVRERGQKINNDPTLSQYADSQRELESKYLNSDSSTNLRNALTNQTQNTVQPQKTVNLSDYITNRNTSQTNQLVSQLKNAIAQSVAAKQQEKTLLPQQYDPYRAQSEVSKSQELRSALERSRNLGDRGGVGRSEALQTQLAGENRLNSINLQQQNELDAINSEINRLQSEGRFQESQILQSQAQALSDALMEEQIRQQGITREDDYRNQQLASNEEETNRQRFIDTIGQYSGDYQAQINSVLGDNDPSNDWQADYLTSARQNKIAGIEQSELSNQQAQQEAYADYEQQVYSRAIQKWDKGIALNAEEAQVLGLSPGARKPVKTSSSGSSSSGSTSDTGRNVSVSSLKTSIKNYIKSSLDQSDEVSDGIVNTLTTQLKSLDDLNDSEYNFDTTKQWEDSKAKAEVIRKRVNEMKSRGSSEREKNSAMMWMIQNQDLLQNDDTYDTIASEYNISDEDLANYSKSIQNVSPSVGR